MPDWLIAVILGVVEGLTEFIPVFSTGHLLLAEHLLELDSGSFFRSDLFNIVVQAGAVVAVLPLFNERLAMLSRWREPASRLFLGKIAAAFFITVLGGLTLDRLDYQLTEDPSHVAWALVAGGVLFIIAEKWLAVRVQRQGVTWPSTFATAAGQLVAAIFPGASRSGATILSSLLCGTNRIAATEFSFLVGIPTILAAGAWKIYKALNAPAPDAPAPDWEMMALGAAAAAIVSFGAVKWLLHFVRSHTFISFGVYRIIVGIALLLYFREAAGS